jgi:hypothetical protein
MVCCGQPSLSFVVDSSYNPQALATLYSITLYTPDGAVVPYIDKY